MANGEDVVEEPVMWNRLFEDENGWRDVDPSQSAPPNGYQGSDTCFDNSFKYQFWDIPIRQSRDIGNRDSPVIFLGSSTGTEPNLRRHQ
jgi:hypothetical protein